MTEQELKEIEDRASAATPGPWVHDTVQSGSAVICGPPPGVVCEWRKGAAAFDDCDFIAHAREDIPKLIAGIRRLQEAIHMVVHQRDEDDFEKGWMDLEQLCDEWHGRACSAGDA